MASFLPTWKPALSKKNICCHCQKELETFIVCSQCEVTKYCDEECKNNSLETHKPKCDEVKQGMDKFNDMIENDEATKRFLNYDVIEYDEDKIDEYTSGCFTLARNYQQLGFKHNSKTALELSLDFYLKYVKAWCFREELDGLDIDLDSFYFKIDVDIDLVFNYIALDQLDEAWNFIIHFYNPLDSTDSPNIRCAGKNFLKFEQKMHKQLDL